MIYAFLAVLLLGILFLIIGIVKLFIGQSTHGFTRIAGKVEGIEKTINTKKGSSSIYLYSPIVTFNVDGIGYAAPPLFVSGESKFRIGDEIEVYYNPENPDDNFSPEIAPKKKLTSLFLGLLFLIAAGAIYYFNPNMLLPYIK